MRLNRTLMIALALTAILLPLASSEAAAGSVGCKKIYAFLDTAYVDDFVEVGDLDGTIEGTAYLRYDDMAPSVDPDRDSANFVITSKIGDINLWVYSADSVFEGESVARNFTILRAAGTGVYANHSFDLKVHGKFVGKMGSYAIEGLICPAKSPKRPKR
jgi:hypothetical protein